MRDYALIALILAFLPVCIARPYIGALMWYVIGYLNPHRMTWGIAQEFPVAELTALATMIGVVGLALRGKLPRIPWTRETILLGLLWMMFAISAMFALIPDESWPQFEKVSKVLLMTFVTLALIDDYRKLRFMLWVVILSIGFYGVKGGLFTVATAGNYLVYGPENSSIADNTALGLALNMTLPLMFFMSRTVEKRWVRLALLGGFGLSALAVFFTYSRGSMLGLTAVLALIVLRLGIKWKVLCAIVVVVATPIAIANIPDQWFDKMSTLKTYEEDSSAVSRIEAWRTSWRIAMDRPLTGGGFNVVQDADIYLQYNPEIQSNAVGAFNTGVHSSYFEIVGENGLLAFAFYAALMIFALRSCRSIRSMAARIGRSDIVQYGWALQIGIVGYAVSGAFLEFGGFDLYYHLIALVIIVKSLLRKELVNSRALRDRSTSRVVGAPLSAPVTRSTASIS